MKLTFFELKSFMHLKFDFYVSYIQLVAYYMHFLK
jgi:hypothetical protein